MTDVKRNFGSDLFVFALESGREDQAVEAVLRLGKLEQLTGWDQATLRNRVGCRFVKRSIEAMSPDKADEVVQHSLDYLDWVAELAALVGFERECRDIVSGARELCASAGGPMSEWVKRCRAAVDRVPAPDGPALSPRGYLELGEIGAAWHVAALQMPEAKPDDEARLVDDLIEPLKPYMTHIDPDRLAFLQAPDPVSHLGQRVYDAMVHHVVTCTRCRKVAGQTPAAADVVPGTADDIAA